MAFLDKAAAILTIAFGLFTVVGYLVTAPKTMNRLSKFLLAAGGLLGPLLVISGYAENGRTAEIGFLFTTAIYPVIGGWVVHKYKKRKAT